MAYLFDIIKVGPTGDKRTFELWAVHSDSEGLVDNRELKRRAITAGIRGSRADREFIEKHSPGIQRSLHGKFLDFTDDIEGDVLIGSLFSTGDDSGRWYADQVELGHPCDKRTLFVCPQGFHP